MLRIEHLKVRYSDDRLALDNVQIQIEEGETVALIGANGAGKSTLLKTIVGIINPEEGTVMVNGTAAVKKNLHKIREMVGVVFQNPEDQLFLSNVYDDLAFGLRNYGMNEEQIGGNITQVMKDLKIEHLRDQNSSRLSGGEQRLVAIATVMVMKPELVLFDEPTSFLDPRTRRNLMSVLKNLPVTKLIATHDLDMALELCDRVIILKDGSVYREGNARELLRDRDLMEKAGLELPFCLQKQEL